MAPMTHVKLKIHYLQFSKIKISKKTPLEDRMEHFYKCRCSGTNKNNRRCKQKVLLPIKMDWTCVDHTIDYESTKMEETKAHVFYIAPKNGGQVFQIRHKFYLDGKIKYLINNFCDYKFVNAEEFYNLPSDYHFYIVS